MKRDKLGRFTTEGIKKIKLLDSWDIIGQIDRVNLLIDSHNDLVKRMEKNEDIYEKAFLMTAEELEKLRAKSSTVFYTLLEKKEEHTGDVAWCNCSCHTKGSTHGTICPKCYEKEEPKEDRGYDEGFLDGGIYWKKEMKAKIIEEVKEYLERDCDTNELVERIKKI